MPHYMMSVAGSDIAGQWESCHAATLPAAKREAARRFGGGFQHHRIQVAEAAGDGPPRVVAERPMTDGEWSDKLAERQQRRRARVIQDGGRGVSVTLTALEAASLDALTRDGTTQRDAIGRAILRAAAE